MEPTDQPDYRRAEFVTRTIAGLAACGIALYCLSGQAAAFFFALALLVTLCHVCNVNPFRLVWRLMRAAVGHKFDTRFTWGELNLHWPRFDIGVRLSSRGDDDGRREPDMLIVHGIVFGLYLHLPTYICARYRAGDRHRWDDGAEFGFYTIDMSVVWKWKQGYYSWQFPFFSMNHYSTEVLALDGKTTAYVEYSGERKLLGVAGRDCYAEKTAAEAANSESHPYTYTRRNGEVQHRVATLYIDRMTWKRKWFPFLHVVRTSIWVTFNEEIGEEVGSWKGGTTGCGYELRAGERPVDSLRRMEGERLFAKGRDKREKVSTARSLWAYLFSP